MPAAKSLAALAATALLALTSAAGAQTLRERLEEKRDERREELREKAVEAAREKARAQIAAAIAAKVRAVQEALSYFGFDAGPADGAYGEQTKAALEGYTEYLGYTPLPLIGPIQSDYLLAVQGLAQSGAPEVEALLEDLGGEKRALLRAYMADPVAAVMPDPDKIKTKNVQIMLNSLGHDPGEIDGAIGPATMAAIDGWRAANGSGASGALTNDEKVAMVLEGWRKTAANVGLPAALRAPRAEEDEMLAALPGAPPAAIAPVKLFFTSDAQALFALQEGDPAACADTPCEIVLYLPGDGGGFREAGRFAFSQSLELGPGYYGGLRDIWIDGWLHRWTGSAYDRDTNLAAPVDRPAHPPALPEPPEDTTGDTAAD